MVYPHLDPQDPRQKPFSSPALRPAPVVDRALAFFVDATILAPVLQLISAPITKQIQFLTISLPESTEISALFFIMVLFNAFIVLFYQTLGLTFFGGTPGKLFLKIRVRTVNGGRPSFGQSFVRSLLWLLEVLFFCIPYLEIFSHPRRRLLHDRASETIVTTLKVDTQELPPQPLEVRFVRQFLSIGTALGFIWVLLFLVRIYDHAEKADFKKSEMLSSHQLCDEVTSDSSNRVDEGLALFLIGEIGADCLKKESDFALWTLHQKQRDWGLLAKSFLDINDRETFAAYHDEICKNPESEPCRISEIMKTQNSVHGQDASESQNDDSSLHSLTATILKLEALEKSGRFEALQNELDADFPPRLRQALLGYRERALWSQRKFEQARGLAGSLPMIQSTYNQSKWLGWACLAEIQQDCQQAALQESCRTIATDTFHQKIEDVSPDAVLAKIQISECTDRHPPLNFVEKDFLRQNETLQNLVEIELAPVPTERKANELAHLYKDSEGVLRERVLEAWTKEAIASLDVKGLVEQIREYSRHDAVWENSALKVFEWSYQTQNSAAALKMMQVLPEVAFTRAGLQKELFISAVETREWSLAKSLQKAVLANSANRAPASAPGVAGSARGAVAPSPDADDETTRFARALQTLKEARP